MRHTFSALAAPALTALVVVAVAVSALGLVRTRVSWLRGASSASNLTVEQRALAIRIARTEAWGSPAWGSPRPGGPDSAYIAHVQPGWPSNVDRVWAVVTTHADAMQYVAAAGGDATPVLVIRLVGNFSWITTGPPGGAGVANGNVMTIVVNAQTGEFTDGGLERQDPPQPLPNATVLYSR